MMLRPMRPNPLIPTFTAIGVPPQAPHRAGVRAGDPQRIDCSERALNRVNRATILLQS